MTAEVTLTSDQLADLMAFGAVFTIVEDAVQDLAAVAFADEEIAAFLTMPDDFQLRISARLVELVEILREELRELDGRVLQVTARD